MGSGIVKVTCDECGDVDLPINEVTLLHCVTYGSWRYKFQCPKCDYTEYKDFEERNMDKLAALRQYGCEVFEWEMPKLSNHQGGEPITKEECREAILILNSCDTLVELVDLV